MGSPATRRPCSPSVSQYGCDTVYPPADDRTPRVNTTSGIARRHRGAGDDRHRRHIDSAGPEFPGPTTTAPDRPSWRPAVSAGRRQSTSCCLFGGRSRGSSARYFVKHFRADIGVVLMLNRHDERAREDQLTNPGASAPTWLVRPPSRIPRPGTGALLSDTSSRSTNDRRFGGVDRSFWQRIRHRFDRRH
jgi:hypothetical protein